MTDIKQKAAELLGWKIEVGRTWTAFDQRTGGAGHLICGEEQRVWRVVCDLLKRYDEVQIRLAALEAERKAVETSKLNAVDEAV